jgi:hypothetical protein
MDFTPESWEVAKARAATLGPPNPLLCGVVRAVRNAPSILKTTDKEKLRAFAAQSAFFPVKVSPTFATAFFFAAREYYPGQLLAEQNLTRACLLSLFEPEELSAILTITYLARLAKKKCPEGGWSSLQSDFLTHLYLGGLIGRHTDGIGLGTGLLIGGLRYIGMAIQMGSSPRAYRELAKRNGIGNRAFNHELEVELLDCSHLQIASVIVSTIGYGIGQRAAFGMGAIDGKQEKYSSALAEAKEEIANWRLVITLCEELMIGTKISDSTMGLINNRIPAEKIDSILRTATSYRDHPDHLCPWFLKGASEVPKSAFTQLELTAQESA